MLDILFVLAFLVSLGFVFRRLKAKIFASTDVALTVQDIGGEVVVWAAQHPGSDFSHPEAQRIIRKCIKRMNKLRRKNPEIPEERIAKLIKLLN